MVEKAIGRRIQARRKKKGLTQEQLAEMIAMSPNHLSAIERGVYNVKLSTLVEIINYLDCTADDLFMDVINSGYKMRSSRLSDMIEKLDVDEQTKIFNVIETMLKDAN